MLIAQKKKTYPISMLCRFLGVKRSGYYHFAKQKNDYKDPTHEEMLEWVKKIAEASDNIYGGRRMKHAPSRLGYPVSRQKAKKLMTAAKVWVRYRKKYKVTTNSNHSKPLFENVLNRGFDVERPKIAYVSDIT
jgi:putative transposase